MYRRFILYYAFEIDLGVDAKIHRQPSLLRIVAWRVEICPALAGLRKCTAGSIDEWMDGWMDGRMDGRMVSALARGAHSQKGLRLQPAQHAGGHTRPKKTLKGRPGKVVAGRGCGLWLRI